MSKKIKIILSALLLALAVGYACLYFWAQNRFISLNQELKQQMQAEDWVVEDSPLVFSGFPFRLTATQEKLKVTKDKSGLVILAEAQNPKMHVSILNPFKYEFEGTSSLSMTQKGLPMAKATFSNGTVELGYQREKLALVSTIIDEIKVDLLSPQGASITRIQAALRHEGGDYTVTDSSDGKIVTGKKELTLKDLAVMKTKDGTLSPFFQLKKVKVTAKAKMPLALIEVIALSIGEVIEGIFRDPTMSPIGKICQNGGKLPPLKATVNFMEKIEGYSKINIEIENANYVLSVDVDAKFKKADIELLATLQVNNLNNLFNAFNLDPTIRLFAHGFIKQESDKSEKAKLIVKLSEGKLSVNDMDITKISTPDWDNIVLPADVCSNKNAPAASTAPAPAIAPLVTTPY